MTDEEYLEYLKREKEYYDMQIEWWGGYAEGIAKGLLIVFITLPICLFFVACIIGGLI